MPRSQVHILAGLAIMSFAVGCNSSQTDQQPLTVKPQPPNYGKFLGHVRTEWIDEPDGRLMCTAGELRIPRSRWETLDRAGKYSRQWRLDPESLLVNCRGTIRRTLPRRLGRPRFRL